MRLRGGNRVTLLRSGTEFFPALLAAIDAARHEVRLETYIFLADGTGRHVGEALLRAVARGVAVRILADGFGSRNLSAQFIETLRRAGVEFHFFRPERGLLRLRRHRLRRLHRKLACIDGSVAFCGGINVVNDLDHPTDPEPRYDYAVRIEGPVARDVLRAMRRLWRLLRWIALRHRPREPDPPLPRVARPGRTRAFLLVRDNLRNRRAIEHSYLKAIRAARQDVLIANAYFFPGRRLRRALVDATRRGVRVRLLLQGRPEYRLASFAMRALYGSLLDAGVEIWEYLPSILHAKVAIVDGDWATVGSSNLDPFSLLLSREANIVIRDADFNRELWDSLEGSMRAGARRVPPDSWKSEPLHARLFAWFAYGLARLALGIARVPRGE